MVFSCTISHYFFYNCVLFRLLLAIFFYLAFSLFILIVISQLACGQWNHNQNYHEQNEIFSLSLSLPWHYLHFTGSVYLSNLCSPHALALLWKWKNCAYIDACFPFVNEKSTMHTKEGKQKAVMKPMNFSGSAISHQLHGSNFHFCGLVQAFWINRIWIN